MIRCLILDDEGPARREMRTLLAAHAEVEIVGEAAGVDEALALNAARGADLAFVDVKLAGETGFDFVARAGEKIPHIVFVTAYDQFAIRAFECNALDYLQKPVHPGRLAEALRRARLREQARHRPAAANDLVYLKAASLARLVPWRDVRHIISEGNYTRVRLEDGIEPLVPRTLKDWLAFVPERIFVQIHRTAIVRLDAIREIVAEGERRHVRLADGTLLPVSRSHWPALKAALDRL